MVSELRRFLDILIHCRKRRVSCSSRLNHTRQQNLLFFSTKHTILSPHLCPSVACGRSPMWQQEIHEYQASGDTGCAVQHCLPNSTTRDCQPICAIILTLPKRGYLIARQPLICLCVNAFVFMSGFRSTSSMICLICSLTLDLFVWYRSLCQPVRLIIKPHINSVRPYAV